MSMKWRPTPMTKSRKAQSQAKKDRKIAHCKDPAYHKDKLPIERRVHSNTTFKPPKDEARQNDLIRECVNWALENEEAMEIDDFPISKLMSPYRFKKLAETNEYFAQGLDLAKSIIASRLKKDVRSKKIDKEYLFKLLPLYSKDYSDHIYDRRDKKKEEENASRTIQYVAVPLIPDSPLVPPLKKEGNVQSDQTTTPPLTNDNELS